MTPASCRVSFGPRAGRTLGRMGGNWGGRHTERVPDDQGQFRDLFAFLAQFHQGRFPTSGIQEFCDPDEDLAILFADAPVHDVDSVRHPFSSHASGATGSLRWVAGAVTVHRNAAIVLLLGGGSGGLDLGMLLGDQGSVLLLRLVVGLSLVVLLMLQPGGIGLGVLMLVREDVLARRLEHGGRTRNTPNQRVNRHTAEKNRESKWGVVRSLIPRLDSLTGCWKRRG